MKYTLITCLLLFNTLLARAQSQDTFQVYFPHNDTKITKDATDYIDKLIFKDVLILGQKLIVFGYTDYVGDNAYNENLSAARAKSVQDYLISNGFTKKDIKICIGKGKINRAPVNGKDGFAQDRKVQIILDRTIDTPIVPVAPPKRPDTVVKRKSAPDMSRAKVNETVALKSILFEPSNDHMLPESYPELEKLLNFLMENKSVNIQIEGHICCMDPSLGPDEPYRSKDGLSTISTSRAKAVYDYLVSKGIDKKRLKYIGLGNGSPLVSPERTDDDRQKNRRVEIRILSK